MILSRLTLSNFQSFAENPTAIEFADLTYVIGPNGSGKTALLQALLRMFGADPSTRRILPSDFHMPTRNRGEESISEFHLWVEAEFAVPEAADSKIVNPTVPLAFTHMRLEGDTPLIRVRLSARMDSDRVVYEERIQYVLRADSNGNPVKLVDMSRHDRNAIRVHYLPARRDPATHISYAANSMVGRALRAANWSQEQRDTTRSLSGELNAELQKNDAIKGLSERLDISWKSLHKGQYFDTAALGFQNNEIDSLLSYLTLTFVPSHDAEPLSFNMLSDGQKSLLYIALILATRAVERDVLSGKTSAYDVDRLRPAVFTIIALEEPENSLSPKYLGRIIKAMKEIVEGNDAQAIIATHAPTILRRVAPEKVRYLRLNEHRNTTVSTIKLPSNDVEAHKFMREAVQAYPEIYFARLVVLGEGDSEELILPRILSSRGISEDDASVVVAPLGGDHGNHFWRLLNDLKIPHLTLIDLDLCRYHGGFGRIKYAATMARSLRPIEFQAEIFSDGEIAKIPPWNSDNLIMQSTWISDLEECGIFFSAPLDLDLMMLEAYPEEYDCNATGELPDEQTIVAVLGKRHHSAERLGDGRLKLFESYHRLMQLGSKPFAHINALSKLNDDRLMEDLPEVLERLLNAIESKLIELPE